jgi:ribosomal protein L7Ae-like RNA K-turn-binding protein
VNVHVVFVGNRIDLGDGVAQETIAIRARVMHVVRYTA